MEAKTLEALRGSIRKWEEIACHDGVDLATDNCPLCQLFFANRCAGCPVSESGSPVCRNSPYIKWSNAIWVYYKAHEIPTNQLGCGIAWTDELAQIAREEVDFLKSLLPKGEQP